MNVRCGKCMCALVGVLASLSSCGISSHTSSGAAAPSTVNIQTGRPLPTEPTTVANTNSVATTVDIQSGGSPTGEVAVNVLVADYPSYSTAADLFGRAEASIIATAVSVGPSFLFLDAPASPDGTKPAAQHLETPISYQVERVLSGTGVTAGQTITSLVTGGSITGRRDVNPDDPAPILKKRYLLLVERTGDVKNTHRVLGGGHGRFALAKGGKAVSSIHESDPSASVQGSDRELETKTEDEIKVAGDTNIGSLRNQPPPPSTPGTTVPIGPVKVPKP